MTVKMTVVYWACHVPTSTSRNLLSHTLTIIVKIVHVFSRVLSAIELSPSRQIHECEKRYPETDRTKPVEEPGPQRLNPKQDHPSSEGMPNNSAGQTPMPVSPQEDNVPTDEQVGAFNPVTLTYKWFTFEGMLQRIIFAFTLGLAAVVLLSFLWTISLPWLAWSLLLRFDPRVLCQVRWTFCRTSSSANGYQKRDAERFSPAPQNTSNVANATYLARTIYFSIFYIF